MRWSRPSAPAVVWSMALLVVLPAALSGCSLLGMQLAEPSPGVPDAVREAPLALGAATTERVTSDPAQAATATAAPVPARGPDEIGTQAATSRATSPAAVSGTRVLTAGRSASEATVPSSGRRPITEGVVSSVRTRDKEIAITIDDGGSPAVCSAMADVLIRKKVAATFFPIGRSVERSPRLWARIARRFPIGNHTAFHAILTRLDDLHIRKQILADERFVRQATGKPPIQVLRPPGGIWDARVRRIAAGLGYRVLVLWDVSAADTAPNSRPEGMLRRALGGGPGSILLMHCNRPVSRWLLPRIIEGYRDRGYRFVTIPDLLAGG